MNETEQAAVRAELQAWLMGAVETMQNDTPRARQVRIGPSELGGCRRLLEAKITGEIAEIGKPMPGVKWAAFVGTAVGDLLETAARDYGGAQVQVPITCMLPSGIQVTGSCDILLPDQAGVIDLKGKDGIEEVQRTGASFEHLVQISAYLVGLRQSGLVHNDALGTLVYYDRSGKTKDIFTVSVTLSEAVGWIEKADERIADITKAIASGEHAPRDWDEPKCHWWSCPMYDACWAGTQPTDEIRDPDIIEAIRLYDEARAMKKTAERLIGNAKTTLGAWEENPVTGATEEFTLNWTLRAGSQGTVNRQIDLRRKR